MNQILDTKNKKIETDDKIPINKKKHLWFKIQLTISSLIMLALISISIYYTNQLMQKENKSNQLMSNYNVFQLYATIDTEKDNTPSSNIFGTIEIKKINLKYPIFSNLEEESLKISPCRFYGEHPSKYGNLCIAGHNYDNQLFFSNISQLQLDDEIEIYDNNHQKYTYYVTEKFEVPENDLSPIYQYEKNQKNLTLLTCNNLKGNRIVIRAKQKSFST